MAAAILHEATANPCVSCGACCAAFRVSFHWLEGEESGGTVPAALTEPLPPHRLCMRGTNGKTSRCIALEGQVGEAVHCTIYEKRSTTCREFDAGPANDTCARARAKYGLPPLAV